MQDAAMNAILKIYGYASSPEPKSQLTWNLVEASGWLVDKK